MNIRLGPFFNFIFETPRNTYYNSSGRALEGKENMMSSTSFDLDSLMKKPRVKFQIDENSPTSPRKKPPEALNTQRLLKILEKPLPERQPYEQQYIIDNLSKNKFFQSMYNQLDEYIY